jgi:hypothetical protein
MVLVPSGSFVRSGAGHPSEARSHYQAERERPLLGATPSERWPRRQNRPWAVIPASDRHRSDLKVGGSDTRWHGSVMLGCYGFRGRNPWHPEMPVIEGKGVPVIRL